MSDDIVISREGAVLVIRMSRPEKLNALTGAMYGAMIAAIEGGDRDDSIAAYVLCGTPGVFTSGNDIADFLATAKGTGGLGTEIIQFIRLLPQIKKPLIAAVDGKAIGIGTTLLFHCDLVYATPQSVFATPFLNLGLIPEAGSSLLMPQRMGYARAFEVLVLGETYTAEQAQAAGFVNRIVPADKLEGVAMAAAQQLAARPPEALAIARRMMRGDVDAIVARVDEEAKLFRQRLASPEAREAFEAFLQKRPPKFRA